MSYSQNELWRLASSLDTSRALLIELSENSDSHLLRLITENINTPESVLLRLASDKSAYVRYGVAKNINVPIKALTILSGSSEYDILRLVSENPNSPEKALLNIIQNFHQKQASLLTAACSNIALRPSTIKRLMVGACIYMKRGFAINENTPTKELCQLATDTPFIRYSVALRSKFPFAVCEIIKNDTNVDVQKALFENEFVPNDVIEHAFDLAPNRLVELIAMRSDLPTSILGKIIYGDNPYAKAELLKSSILKPNELEHLASDESHLVRIEVAKQSNVPSSVLSKLKGDPSTQVVVEVVRNEFVSIDVLVQLSEHQDSVVRKEVALKDTITEGISYDLSDDVSSSVKKALIQNPRALLGAISDLVFDVDEGVSKLARGILNRECVVSSKYEYLSV